MEQIGFVGVWQGEAGKSWFVSGRPVGNSGGKSVKGEAWDSPRVDLVSSAGV